MSADEHDKDAPSEDAEPDDAKAPHGAQSDDAKVPSVTRSSEKRRLPVLQAGAPQEAEEERPAWHWVPLGAFATFLVWLPLAALAERVVRHFTEAAEARGDHLEAAGVWLLASHALAFFAGAFAGGVLVGRLGTKARRREAALGGVLAGVLAWLIAAGQGTPGGALVWGLLVVIIGTLGAGAGALGGVLGKRWRARSGGTT